MKFFILLALLAVTFADNDGGKLHIPNKCEDVLAVKVCDKLKKTAETLKLKSEEVKKGLVDAYTKGKKTAIEIEAAVNDFLVNQVLNKKCEDFTTVEVNYFITLFSKKLKNGRKNRSRGNRNFTKKK